MAERYSRLFSLTENLYAPGAPVIVAAGALLKDSQTDRVLAQLKLRSISSKRIKAAKVRVFPLDTVNRPLDGTAECEHLDLSVERDMEFGQKTPIYLSNASTRAFSVEVTEVDFEDNSVWTSAGEPWEPLPAPESVGDAELTKQYQLHFGHLARYKPVRRRGVWLCACGGINSEGEEACHICGSRIAELLACDLTALAAERDQRLAEERAAAEAEAKRKRAAAEAEAKRKKKIRSIVILAAAVCVLCAAAVRLTTGVIIPNSRYSRAKALLDAGRYEEAIVAFEAMGGYKDSAEQIAAAKEAMAEEERLAREAELAEQRAREEQLAREAELAERYARAEQLARDGKRNEAAAAFEQIIDYRDARQRSMDLRELTARKVPIAAGGYHTLGLRSDGRVVAVGSRGGGRLDVYGWTDIVAVAAGFGVSVGLRSDGTVVAAGGDKWGYDLYWTDPSYLSGWTDIVAVAAGGEHIVGLRSDGTVVAAGHYFIGGRYTAYNVSDWTDIVAVAAGFEHIVGLRADGTAVAVGNNEKGQCDVSGWTDIVAISAGGAHTVGLRSDGTLVAVGDNRYGQCDVSGWTDITAVAAGGNHTVGLQSDGTVVAVGYNEDRRCNVSDWTDIVAIAAGYSHTVGLRSDGTAVAIGYNKDNYTGRCNVGNWMGLMQP